MNLEAGHGNCSNCGHNAIGVETEIPDFVIRENLAALPCALNMPEILGVLTSSGDLVAQDETRGMRLQVLIAANDARLREAA